jgi:MoaA/NifB/PqqE/SkfB family radical SAM enzyme
MIRLDWLAEHGVRKVNLSGGEPTIRRDLPQIIAAVDERGLRSAMTTNGILLSPEVQAALADSGTKVKVSIHGPADHHDEVLGRRCFDTVVANVDRLLAAGVATAVQTVATRRQPDAWRWMVDFCLARGIRKHRVLPFVPRGRGLLNEADYALSLPLRRALEEEVAATNARLGTRLDLQVIDFWTQEYYVVETDGRLQVQRETDSADTTVAHLG